MTNLWQKFWIWLGGEVESPSRTPALLSNLSDPLPTPSNSKETQEVSCPATLTTRKVTVREEDTLFSLAQKHNISVQAIAQLNYLDEQSPLHVGQVLKVPLNTAPLRPQAPEEAIVCRIRQKDSIQSIARRFALPPQIIIAENKLEKPEKLIPGQWLIIPGKPKSTPPELPHPEQTGGLIIPFEQSAKGVERKPASDKQQLINDEGKQLKAPSPPRHQPSPVIVKTAPPPAETTPPIPENTLRGLYLSHHALNSKTAREHILKLLHSANLNTLVIDFKDDWGYLSQPSQIPLAQIIGAGKLTTRALPALLQSLQSQQAYTIARIVTFKDSALAKTRPDLAAKSSHSKDIWRDHRGQFWVDPFQEEVWNYNLEIALEASRLGFDEIVFDAAHFPRPGLNGRPQFSQPLTIENRLNALSGFLSVARGQLLAAGAKTGSTLSGYACWRKDDNLIGQNIERMAPYLDALHPFLFPNAFVHGIPGCANPADCPRQIITGSARQAAKRLKAINRHCRLIPWLQASQDANVEIQTQIQAALDGGADGFMLWDPKTEYKGIERLGRKIT
ncbi:MAG TPA: LysM peptidoglycan-binding domain-containing protein [Chloroflexi bacterium]|nr:LysM peptidoglycan-binding domain-containing protein [Chloroflexota bacterium]